VSKNEKRKSKPIDPVDQLEATPVLPEDNIGQSLERAPTTGSSIADVEIIAHRNATSSTTGTKSTVAEPANAMSGAVDNGHGTTGDKFSGAPKPLQKKRFSTILGKLKRKPKSGEKDESTPATTEKGFEGGAAYTGAFAAGIPSSQKPAVDRSPSISSLSSDEETAAVPSSSEQERGRTTKRTERDVSGSEEEFEEARDTFDGSALAPPPKFLSQKTGSPARETRFSEAL
jgi:hypothetical protein